MLTTGIVVGVELAGDDESADSGTASGVPTALDEVGDGTPGSPLYGYLELGAADVPVVTPVATSGASWSTASGVEFDVPDGAYTSDLSFTVTETEIAGQTFGELVAPASKLITVDNGGVEAAVPVEVTFPVEADDDQIALAVFYDANAGRIEPLPIVAAEDGTITTITRHFSSIFVTLVDLALLTNDMIDSGFRPGVDDWDFVNNGSYIASNGHCSGQSLSAMWYYVQQRIANGAAPLFNRFDDRNEAIVYGATTGLDADDRDGYRLASMVQDDEANAYDAVERAFDDATKAKLGTDQYYAFAYAILVTGEPQYVGMYADAGGGHAMIVYAVTDEGLLIADPNFPGAYKTITYDAGSGVLGPYKSALNASSPGLTFQAIGYYGKSALVDWTTLGGRWDQFLDGTIGAGKFPAMNLEVQEEDEDGDEVWVALTDGYEVDEDQDSIIVRLAGTAGWNDRLRAYDWTTLLVDNTSWDTETTVPLHEGLNRLGFEAIGFDWSQNQEGWVDFERIKVIRGELDETPLDLVFVIDLTSSMEDDIAGVKEAASGILRTVSRTNEDWRVAVVGYRDVGDEPMFEDYEFTDDADTAQGYIDALSVSGGGDTPEAVYEALSRAIDSSTIGGWRELVNKQTILMGDAPGHNPGSGGETPESVALEAELADPVVIQSVVIGNSGYIDPEAQADFANLSALTYGQTFTATDAAAVPAALEQSIGATAETTVAGSDEGTDWARMILLIAALLLLVGGAGVVVWRLLLPTVVPVAMWRRIGAAAAVGVLGLAGVGWWTFTEDEADTADVRSLSHAGPPDDSDRPDDSVVIPSVSTAPGTTMPGATTTDVAAATTTAVPLTLPSTVAPTVPPTTVPPTTVPPTTVPITAAPTVPTTVSEYGPEVTPPAGYDTSSWAWCINTEEGWEVAYPSDWYAYVDPAGEMYDCSIFAPFDMTGMNSTDAYQQSYVNIGRLFGHDLASYTESFVQTGSWESVPVPSPVVIDGRAAMVYSGVIPADDFDPNPWGVTEFVVDLGAAGVEEVGWVQAVLPMSVEYDIAADVAQAMASTIVFTT